MREEENTSFFNKHLFTQKICINININQFFKIIIKKNNRLQI